MRKSFFRYIWLLLGVPIVGLLLIWAVHLLPTYSMHMHVYASKGLLEKEFTNGTLVDGYNATLTGNFTDCLMLEHAIYNGGHSAWQQALNMYRGESYYDAADPNAWHPGESLRDHLNGKQHLREVTYARYWHGYLVILKPLLMLTSPATLRLFNSGLQLLLVGFCVMLLERRKQSGSALAFLGSIPFLYFVSSFASISLSVCMYLMLFLVITQLKWDEILTRKNNYVFFFLLAGMLTSYFDFLTYPLVTLGYPLGIYFCLHDEKVKDSVKRLVQYSVNWAIGYFWMWFTKWVFATAFTKNNILADAFNTLSARTAGAGQTGRILGFFKVIRLNIDAYLNWGFFALVLLFVVIIIGLFLRNKGKLGRLQTGIPFLILALYPLGWWFVTQNHSEEHWMFTCRIFAVSVFAVLGGIQKILKTKE